MFKYHCLNPISAVGMNKLDENYVKTENADEADVILVRSAKMHEMEFGKNLKAIARAGAGVNNIPLDKCAEEGIVVSVIIIFGNIVKSESCTFCALHSIHINIDTANCRKNDYRLLLHFKKNI